MPISEFIGNLIRDCVERDFFETDGMTIFESPLIGFADGDDPLFMKYKKIIGSFHFTPKEILKKHFPSWDEKVDSCSVVCWVLPIAEGTRKSNATRSEYPSEKWAYTKFFGEKLNNNIRKTVVSHLLEEGYLAVAPVLSSYVITRHTPDIASSWSERHALYVAGLGTFSLSDGFITPKGIAMRCGSVVTNLKIEATIRRYENHLENCLFFTSGKCGVCIKRCPIGAINENGHDKKRCREYVNGPSVDYVRRNYGIKTSCCGLCQTGVPCESKIPT
jgi:epoxyqueuosine reductase QueG